MKSRLIAALALSVTVVLGTSGCAMLASQATEIQYSPSDGVNIPDSGPLQLRNVLIVANDEGTEGNLIAAVINSTDEAHTLTIDVEGGSTEEVRVPANTTISFGDELEDTPPLLLDDITGKPGSTIPIYFQSGDAEGILFQVPVLDGTLDYLSELVP